MSDRESPGADGKSRRSKRRSSRDIPTFKDCAWLFPIGRPSEESFEASIAAMRQTLHRRLQELEVERARVRTLRGRKDSDEGAALRKVMLFLQMRGVERAPTESMMEALARALEISPREMKEQLRGGIDPIHTYFEGHGVFEEITRRKAAGTWPGGGKEEKSVRA